MRRLFWLALGITLGVLTMRRISALAERMTPQGMASSLGQGLSDLAASIGEFSADVRAAMTEREEQLRSSTGLDGRLGRVAPVRLDAAEPTPEAVADPPAGPPDVPPPAAPRRRPGPRPA